MRYVINGLYPHHGLGVPVNELAALSVYALIAAGVSNLFGIARPIHFSSGSMYAIGGAENLITYPMSQTYAAVPEDYRRILGVDDRSMRLSGGLEDAEDLWAELDRALRS